MQVFHTILAELPELTNLEKLDSAADPEFPRRVVPNLLRYLAKFHNNPHDNEENWTEGI